MTDGSIYVDTDDTHFWQAQLVGGSPTVADSMTNYSQNEESLTTTSWYGASWTPSSSYTMTQISVYMGGRYGAISVYLYLSSGGKPTGSILATYSGTASGAAGWYSCTGIYALSSSSTYCWILYGPGGSIYGQNSGNGCYTGNSGSTWGTVSGESYAFQTYYAGSPTEKWVQIK